MGEAMAQLGAKIKNEGPMVLYQGALANALASFVGSYPWYFVFNALQESIPMAPAGVVWMKLCRHALCGFGATCVSDCVSNVIRVLKTTVQTAEVSISYTEAASAGHRQGGRHRSGDPRPRHASHDQRHPGLALLRRLEGPPPPPPPPSFPSPSVPFPYPP